MYHVEYNPDEITLLELATENALKGMMARDLKWIDPSSEVGTESDWDYEYIKVFIGGAKFSADEGGKPVVELADGAFKAIAPDWVEDESKPGKDCYRFWITNENATHDFKICRCDVVLYCIEGDDELHPRRIGTFNCDYQVRPLATDGTQEIEVGFYIDKESIELDGQFFYGSDNLPKSSHDIATKEQE